MSAADLLLAAAAEAREADRADLAEAATNAAYLLGALRQVGAGLGLPPPHQVLVGLQGLRLWSLQLRGLDGLGADPSRPGSLACRSCQEPSRSSTALGGGPGRRRGRSAAPSPSATPPSTSAHPPAWISSGAAGAGRRGLMPDQVTSDGVVASGLSALVSGRGGARRGVRGCAGTGLRATSEAPTARSAGPSSATSTSGLPMAYLVFVKAPSRGDSSSFWSSAWPWPSRTWRRSPSAPPSMARRSAQAVVAVAVGAVLGDLIEAFVKHHFAVRTRGTVLAGFGGLLDRVDSLLIALPLGYYALLVATNLFALSTPR